MICIFYLDSGNNSKRNYLCLPEEPEKKRKYIVTMGPLHPSSFSGIMLKKKAEKMNTCADFWRLCWETNSRIIVMLCAISPGYQVQLILKMYTKLYDISMQNNIRYVQLRDVRNIFLNLRVPSSE